MSIPLHVVAINAIVKKDNKYLLARRSYQDDQSPGEWSLPGGKVENEVGKNRLQEALKREVLEEVDIEITDEIELIYNDSFIRSSGDFVIMLTFVCHWKAGEAKPLEDQAEVVWLTAEEISTMSDLPEHTKSRLSQIIK